MVGAVALIACWASDRFEGPPAVRIARYGRGPERGCPMTGNHNDGGHKWWWQRPEMLTGIAGLITATATLVGVLTGNGSGPA